MLTRPVLVTARPLSARQNTITSGGRVQRISQVGGGHVESASASRIPQRKELQQKRATATDPKSEDFSLEEVRCTTIVHTALAAALRARTDGAAAGRRCSRCAWAATPASAAKGPTPAAAPSHPTAHPPSAVRPLQSTIRPFPLDRDSADFVDHRRAAVAPSKSFVGPRPLRAQLCRIQAVLLVVLPCRLDIAKVAAPLSCAQTVSRESSYRDIILPYTM